MKKVSLVNLIIDFNKKKSKLMKSEIKIKDKKPVLILKLNQSIEDDVYGAFIDYLKVSTVFKNIKIKKFSNENMFNKNIERSI